jgi:thiosulfate/3-mercaptopyruvate sulfurtransferase
MALRGNVTRNFQSSVLVLLAPLGLAPANSAEAQCGPPSLDRPRPRPELTVSTPWLAAHLRDSGLVVVHVESDAAAYRAGHIPGARLADPMAFTVGDHDLPAPDALRMLVEELGIGNDDRVVLYGETWHVGWLYVALDRLGHGARTALLDGGLPQWRAEGRPLESGAPAAVARARFTVEPHDFIATTEWIRARLGSRRLAVIDVRSREEYLAGHLPTARHLDWSQTFSRPDSALNNQASLFLSADRLDAMFREAGAAPGREVVIYCTVGLRASLMYWLARRLGYTPRFYDGSWAAWSTTGQPIATGTEPGSVR